VSAVWQPLLEFWFGTLHEGCAAPQQRRLWFTADADFDQQCEAFRDALEALEQGRLQPWLGHAEGCLAYILLADQFARNLYRNDARAWALDAQARAAAVQGIRRGFDRGLGIDHRAFFYRPFAHAEELLYQHLSVGLYTSLRDSSAPTLRQITGNELRSAQQHRDVIQRFGRFPHRNQLLGRHSTSAELAYLAAKSSA